MLHTQKLTAELEATRGRLAGYQQAYSRDLGAYRAALAALGTRYPSAAAIKAAQAALVPTAGQGGVSLGARPTAEYDAWRRAGGAGLPVLPFGRAFAHHEEARAWAEGVRGWTTLAVGGSPVLPLRAAPLPGAAGQAGPSSKTPPPPPPRV